MKEKVITAYEVPEAQEGDIFIRIPLESDKAVQTMRQDRETGESITLWEEKLRYPYKVVTKFKIVVKTSIRTYEFPLKMENGVYIWNGSNIPSVLWSLLGISKDSPQGWLASLVHDNILQYKQHFYSIAKSFNKDISVDDFRLLTTEIYKRILENNGINKFKTFLMGASINFYQKFFNPEWKSVN